MKLTREGLGSRCFVGDSQVAVAAEIGSVTVESLEHYVFGTTDGARVRDIKTAWVASCRRAGIRDLRFHDLRHEAGSRKLEAGYPMHVVSLWLGHTDLTTTARYLNADIGKLHALNDRPVSAAGRATP